MLRGKRAGSSVGVGDKEYCEAFDAVVMPILREFDPGSSLAQ